MRLNRDNITEGYATSVSYSPFDRAFYDWIEDGIKPLVKALVDKNYMPISSCEGHGISDNVNVVLAFVHPSCAYDFIEYLEPLQAVGIYCKEMQPEEFMEQSTPMTDHYKKIPELRKKGVNVRRKMTSLEARNCLNNMFSRASATWCLVELVVVAGTDHCMWWTAMWNHWICKPHRLKLITEIVETALPPFDE